MTKLKDNEISQLLLRFGLGFVFTYAALSSLIHPAIWASFLPAFMREHLSGTSLVRIFAVYELALVAWLAIGKYLKYVSLLCTLTLLGIVVFNTTQLMTTFRDIGLASMALALFFMTKNT